MQHQVPSPESVQTASACYTVAQFLNAHHISRTHFYEMLKRKQGPRLMKIGRRTLVSVEAAADWRREMEEAARVEESDLA